MNYVRYGTFRSCIDESQWVVTRLVRACVFVSVVGIFLMEVSAKEYLK